MKRVLEPISVKGRDREPYLVKWQGRVYEVLQVLETWVVKGRWWSQEERRAYFQLVLKGRPASRSRYARTMVVTIYFARVEGGHVGGTLESIADADTRCGPSDPIISLYLYKASASSTARALDKTR